MQGPCEPHIIHESDDWIVVNKPAGWHTVRLASSPDQSVEGWLEEHRPEQRAWPESGIAHRLDAGTSGCLAVARSIEMFESLRAAFQGRFSRATVRKVYLAELTAPVKQVGDFSLHFSNRYKGSKKVSVSNRGTAWDRGECRWQRVGGKSTLIRIELVGAGRRHQIRAGMASVGAPLVGDLLYGAPAGAPDAPHVWPHLHAWQLSINGIKCEAPLPSWASTEVA
ncbi:MAG: RNA pseudouridine synthase [Planctomycetota bacterium]|nr:RNA pseudouridine synthase [Planctomycetota bacterium]